MFKPTLTLMMLVVFQPGEAAERPDKRWEWGRSESRGRRDVTMIHRRSPPPGGAAGRGCCYWWDPVALHLLWTEVKGHWRTNQASPRRAVLLILRFLGRRWTFYFLIVLWWNIETPPPGANMAATYGNSFLRFLWLVFTRGRGPLLRCDWLLKHQTETQPDFFFWKTPEV